MNRILLLSAMLLCVEVHAQGTSEDYKRAFSVHQRFRKDMVLGTAENARWTSHNTFSYDLRTK
ncbi:MAG: hypothetical protein SPE98_01335, partial [Bacteroidaceae bacterium]|nr:hypothetical protein [Bacteroidaceae bacterium]